MLWSLGQNEETNSKYQYVICEKIYELLSLQVFSKHLKQLAKQYQVLDESRVDAWSVILKEMTLTVRQIN